MSLVKPAATCLISSAMPFLLSVIFLRSLFQIENYYCPLKAEGGKTVCLEHLLFGVRGCFFNSKPPSVKEREARR